MRTLRRFYTVLALLALGGGLLALAFATPLLATRADFSAYNAGWNGASQLARSVHGAGAFNPLFAPAQGGGRAEVQPAPLDLYPLDPGGDAVLIVGPRAPFSAAEIEHLRSFLARGGTLVLADDFGTGNDVLVGVGAQSRIMNGRALDFAFAKRPEFTIAIDFVDHPLTDGVQRVLLNYPAAILPGNGTLLLANTTDAAWLDADADSERDATEVAGPFGWLASEPVGDGTLIVLSDPSILINGMQELGHNARFRENLVAFLSEREGSVVIDEAHRDTADPLAYVGLRVRAMPLWARIAAVAAASTLVLLVATGKLRAPFEGLRGLLARVLSAPEPEPAREALIERLRKRHPQWDETALREILDAWGVKEPR